MHPPIIKNITPSEPNRIAAKIPSETINGSSSSVSKVIGTDVVVLSKINGFGKEPIYILNYWLFLLRI